MKSGKRFAGRIVLLVVLLAIVGLAGSGCVGGLQSIGWSGGKVDNGTLLVGSKEGRLVSINLSDESRKWSVALKQASQGGFLGCAPSYGGGCSSGAAGVAIYGTPAVYEDLAYIAGYNGKVYAYNKATMELRWVYPREDFLEPFVGGIAASGGTLYFGGSDGIVYALDAATGDKVGEFQTGDKIWSTPVVNGDTLLVGSFDKKLYALDAADISRVKWEYTTEGAIIATPLVEGDTIYIGSFDRNLYALNAADGSLKWKFTADNWFWATPLVYGNAIYAACLDGNVYALNADTGERISSFKMDSAVASTPVLFESSIIVASRDGLLYSINTADNSLRELADIEESIYGPIVVHDGIVYIHTQDLSLRRVNAVNGAILRQISLESPD